MSTYERPGPVGDQGDLADAMMDDIRTMSPDEMRDALRYLVGHSPASVLSALDHTHRVRLMAARREGGEVR